MGESDKLYIVEKILQTTSFSLKRAGNGSGKEVKSNG